MRVLLTHSYQLTLDRKQARILEPYPPLGTLYAAAGLRAKGHEVFLSDPMLAAGRATYEQDLERYRPALVAIYEDSFNYLSKMCLTNMREEAFFKISRAKERGGRVVVHGSDAVDHLEAYLDAGADFIILGEGERTLDELAHTLAHSPLESRYSEIEGLVYRDEKAVVRRNGPRPLIRNLDEVPFPAWDLVDIERYRRAWSKRHHRFSINMVTTRGCPYHCNWCAKPIYGQRYNVRSPENVADEMLWLKENVRPDHIWFADDIFGLRRGWVEQFAVAVKERDCVVPFKIQARVDLIDASVAEALARSGCESVWVGAESGSQEILDAMEKGIRVEEIYEATRLLRGHGVQIGFFLQFGYPGEGEKEIQKTLRMVRECCPDDIGISVSYPLPGTPFYERVQSELREKKNWSESNDMDVLFHSTYTPEYYRALYELAHYDFRMRKERRKPLRPGSMARTLWNGLALYFSQLRLKRLSRIPNRT